MVRYLLCIVRHKCFFMKRKMHLWTIDISWCHYHGWVLFDSIFGECDNRCFSVLKTTRCSTANGTTREGNVTLIEWTQLLFEFPVKCAYMINRNTHDVFGPPEDGRVTRGISKPWHRDYYPNKKHMMEPTQVTRTSRRRRIVRELGLYTVIIVTKDS